MYTVGMWIFVWSIPATAFLIVAGTQKEVVSYERGMVEEKRTSDSEDSDNYYVIVVKDDGTEHKYKVTDGLYSQIEEGEVVRLTRKKSVFGIQYDEVARQ